MIRISSHSEDLDPSVSDEKLSSALMAAAGRSRRTKIIDEVVKEIRAGIDGPARFKFWERTGVVVNA